MLARIAIAAFLLAMLPQAVGPARADDQAKFPDWSGQWRVTGGNRWDPAKPAGRDQDAPLTPEYLAIFEANVAVLAAIISCSTATGVVSPGRTSFAWSVT